MRPGFRAGVAIGLSMVVTLLAIAPSPAGAAVTIGRIGDASASICTDTLDWLQPTVLSGNSYIVPGTGTITSWATNSSGPGGQQMTMKMWRKAGEPNTYEAVGHAGPQTLTPGSLNTFPANIRVKPGDVLGFHTITGEVRCAFPAMNEHFLVSPTDLADGQSAAFFDEAEDVGLNIQATFIPDNTFTVAGTQRNKKKGTATLSLNLPNSGDLTGSGKGARVASARAVTSKAVPAGIATLLVKAKGKKKRKLNETGKVKLSLLVTFTPTGGNPGTQSVKVKLKKKI